MLREAIIVELRSRGFKAIPSSTDANEVWVCCPFCLLSGKTEDTEYKFGLNVRKNMAHCFRCHWKSREAFQQLKITGMVAEFEEEKKETSPVRLPEDFELLSSESSDDWMKLAWSYVTSRAVHPQQIFNHRIGLSLVDKFRHRVVFPIFKERQLIGYTGRTLVKGLQPPWLHSEHLRAVYPARWSTNRVITLVEGVFDALTVERWLHRSTDVVALLGTKLTEEKMYWIAPYSRVVVWLDPDRAGREGAVALAEQLMESGRSVEVVQSPADPSDLTEQEVKFAFQMRRSWRVNFGISILSGWNGAERS